MHIINFSVKQAFISATSNREFPLEYLKRACFCVNKNLDASFADLLKAIVKKIMNIWPEPQVVIYENGMTTNGWIQKQ